MRNDNLTRAEARIRGGIISAVEYEVAVVFSGGRSRDAGGAWVPSDTTFLCTVTATFSASQPSTFMDCDAAEIREISLNGTAVAPSAIHDGRIELAGLDTTPGHINELRVVADMEYSGDGIGIHRHIDQTDGRMYLYSNSEPFEAHRWFACFDQSDIRARLTLTVTAPADWKFVSNYPADPAGNTVDGRMRTVAFEQTPPISTYVMAVCAGEYHEVRRQTTSGISCSLFVRQSLTDVFDADNLFATTERGLEVCPALFGQPYPFAKYDQVFVPEFNAGAMENVGCVTVADEIAVFRSQATRADHADRANTILHEMAHMWFGDLVTMAWWDDLWLNESFATFMGTHLKVATGEYPDAWVDFANAERSWALRQDQLPSTHPISADAPDVRRAQLNFDGITYAKGAAVLRQLVAYVGEDTFFEGVRDYLARHAWGNASMSDLLSALERASGRDLAHWADRWLTTTGMSLLRPVIDEAPDGGRYRSVGIAQEPSADGSFRPHRVVLGCYSLAGGTLSRTDRIEIDVDGPLTPVPQLAGTVVPDLLLLNDENLTFAKVALDQHTVATLVEHLGKIADPLARTICWTNAWDMTRDAGIPTRDWVELVTGQAATEQEPGVLRLQLGRAALAVEFYGDPGNRHAARERLSSAAHTAMAEAEPASDRQLIWAMAFVQTANRSDHLSFLRRWLDGQVAVPGIDIGGAGARELRWEIVTTLVASGWITDQTPEGLIAAELRRDPADTWRRASLTASAARPTAAAKHDAWEQIIGDGPLNLKERTALIGGFGLPGQDELMVPYIERWVDVVPSVWEAKTHDLAEQITTGLYPRMIADDSVTIAANRVLATPGLDPRARRLVVEALDGTQRALRARRADAEAGRSGVVDVGSSNA